MNHQWSEKREKKITVKGDRNETSTSQFWSKSKWTKEAQSQSSSKNDKHKLGIKQG